jgi:MATE family multidrug resistance protein
MTVLDQTSASGAATVPEPTTSWAGEFRALFILAWPLILAQLAQNALLTTDIIMMGWLGPKYLAAGMLAHAFFFALQLFGIGLVGAVAPLVAQALGASDIKAVRRIVRAGIWAGVILAVLLLPLIWNVRPILLALGQAEESARLAEEFLHFAVWLIFPAFWIIVIRSFLAAHGATRVILLITIAGVAVNAAGNYALMFGNWGFPRLELRGSGITTTIVNFVMLALMLIYVNRHRRFRRYHIFARFFEPDWARLREIFQIGAPIGLMLLAEVGLFSVAAFLMGWLGTDEVAAHAIALQCASLAFMVPLGLSQASTVRVGLAFGSRSPEGIRKAGWMSLLMTLAFMSMTAALFLAVPNVVVGLFLDASQEANRNALMLGATYLGIAGLFQLVDGAQVSAGAALRGLSDTKWPLIIALVGYWLIGMPTAYTLGFTLGWRGVGIWIGLAAGLAVVAVVLVARFALRERLGLLRRPSA